MEALKPLPSVMPLWQQELAEAIRDPAELLALLGLDAAAVKLDASSTGLDAAGIAGAAGIRPSPSRKLARDNGSPAW